MEGKLGWQFTARFNSKKKEQGAAQIGSLKGQQPKIKETSDYFIA